MSEKNWEKLNVQKTSFFVILSAIENFPKQIESEKLYHRKAEKISY